MAAARERSDWGQALGPQKGSPLILLPHLLRESWAARPMGVSAGWALLAVAEGCLSFLLNEIPVLISACGSSSADLGILSGTVQGSCQSHMLCVSNSERLACIMLGLERRVQRF